MVFDWNGCMLDDFVVAHVSMNRILEANGKKKVNAEKYRDTFDMPLLKLYQNFGFETYPAGGQEIYADVVKELAPQVKLRPDVDVLLQENLLNGGKNILVSNSKFDVIYPVLLENKLDVFFNPDDIISFDHPTFGGAKTKVENFSKYAASQVTGVAYAFIGDTAEEIDMARSVNGIALGITGGYMSEHHLWMHKPDFVVNNFTQATGALRHTGFLPKKLVV
jgi:phosphoglycolate phosphatase-like HAD superfamily hydrolase